MKAKIITILNAILIFLFGVNTGFMLCQAILRGI